MLNKPFSEIGLEDIRTLKADEVEEGKSIDYKRDLNLDSSPNEKNLRRILLVLLILQVGI